MKKKKGKKMAIFLIVLMLATTGLVTTSTGLEINQKEETSIGSKNTDDKLTRPWNEYKKGIDWNWAGAGLAEAEAKVDEYEGEMSAFTEICMIGRNSAEAWFDHGENNYKIQGYETGHYDINFWFYYRGWVKGVIFGLGGQASAKIQLTVTFAGVDKTFTLYDRDDWPQTIDTDRFDKESQFVLPNVYLKEGNRYNFKARLKIKSVSKVETFTADSAAKIKIYEAYLKKVEIPGGKAMLEVDPSSWNPGAVTLGEEKSCDFVLKNTGAESAMNVKIKLKTDYDSGYYFTGTSFTGRLRPNEEKEFSVRFEPTGYGQKTAKIVITSDNCPTITINMVGECAKGKSREGFIDSITNRFPIFTKILNKLY